MVAIVAIVAMGRYNQTTHVHQNALASIEPAVDQVVTTWSANSAALKKASVRFGVYSVVYI